MKKFVVLRVYSLDQIRPLNFSQRRRNCHIKFMSIDDQVAIMGSGNMDSQSWFHSQETKKKRRIQFFVFASFVSGN